MYEILFYMLLLALFINGLRYLPFVLKYLIPNYKYESDISLFNFLFDTGNLGEGLTFFELEKIKTYSKILTNVYLPTETGMTELDLVYIATSGIYVLESKNYSDWIFCSEQSKFWTSVIYKAKNKFLNPIWQNRKHVKYLKSLLGDISVKSIIVFSQRCEFKKLEVGNNVVIKRKHLRDVIQQDLSNKVYSEAEIDDFYRELKKYSNQSDLVKKQHIQDLKSKT